MFFKCLTPTPHLLHPAFIRFPGRGGILPPRSGVHAVRIAEVRLRPANPRQTKSTTDVWLRYHQQPPPQPSPRGGSKTPAAYKNVCTLSGRRQASPSGEVPAKRPERVVYSRCRKPDAGCRAAMNRHPKSGSGITKTPTPTLPQGREGTVGQKTGHRSMTRSGPSFRWDHESRSQSCQAGVSLRELESRA